MKRTLAILSLAALLAAGEAAVQASKLQPPSREARPV